MNTKLTSLLGLILSLSLPLTSSAGPGEGNGGDAYSAEFVLIARALQASLVAQTSEQVDATAFLNAINTTTVESVDDVLYLDGIPKDAINYPDQKKIVISRPRWMTVQSQQKSQIVLHEFLWIMNITDQNYAMSSAVLLGRSIVLPAPPSPNVAPLDDPSYVTEWCTDAKGALNLALGIGYQAATAANEKAVLINGIQNARRIGSARFQKFFAATLDGALSDINAFPQDLRRQVYLLRTYIGFALDDLSQITRYENINDNGPYVFEILRRALGFATLSKTDVEEYNLLIRVVQRALPLLDQSDGRRAPQYACAREFLSNSIGQFPTDGDAFHLQVMNLLKTIQKVSDPSFSCEQ